MQTLKQLGLLFQHISNFKQGVNSLQTDADAEAFGAPIQAYEQLQAGREFSTDRCRR
jgi:hypothetical protein